jgi:4'-phosphopantetheinyl transferase EntD
LGIWQKTARTHRAPCWIKRVLGSVLHDRASSTSPHLMQAGA